MPNDNCGDGAKPVLIFPGGMPHSLDYLQKCLRAGLPVIGASSLNYDVASREYPAWLHLPYINQAGFDDALRRGIEDFDIGGIYSPNPVVWNYLSRALPGIAPGVKLVNDSPVNEVLAGYRAARVRARLLLERPLPLASRLKVRPAMAEIELAALFHHANQIPGMCDLEKIDALHEIARCGVSGDIVEIGSWWGKSAFVLARLARYYEIGNLLCVDPWSNEHLVQHEGEGMVDSGSAQVDAEEALAVFEMNLLPYSSNHVNYLRMPSTDGARYYREHRDVATASFGSTSYRGDIAILHVDGNHGYAAARADISSWSGFVIAGGWIVIDDYVWPFGDGPRRAGNEFLADNRSGIAVAFVAGSALFIQMA
ncbi:MAG: class I SAM-dependent methyltransferase [Rhodocyclales bacterium]|nr:class I SAM-dependent methyltransferase [Rhodocyclales bacterium]